MIAQVMPARRGTPGMPGTNGTDGVPGWSLGLADIPGGVGALQTVQVNVPVSPPLTGTPPAAAKIVAEIVGAPNLLMNLRADSGSAVVVDANTVRVPVSSLLTLGTLTGGTVKVTIKR